MTTRSTSLCARSRLCANRAKNKGDLNIFFFLERGAQQIGQTAGFQYQPADLRIEWMIFSRRVVPAVPIGAGFDQAKLASAGRVPAGRCQWPDRSGAPTRAHGAVSHPGQREGEKPQPLRWRRRGFERESADCAVIPYNCAVLPFVQVTGLAVTSTPAFFSSAFIKANV